MPEQRRARPLHLVTGAVTSAVLVGLVASGGTAAQGSNVRPEPAPNGHRPAALPAGLVRRTLQVGDVRRHYLLAVPPGTPASAPLVIALHGLHGTAGWMAVQTGLYAAAQSDHVVLAVPDSIGPAWNDGRLGDRGPSDQAFVLGLIDQLSNERIVDPRRVVLTGFSNGAEMSLVMAAHHPRAFAAVVSVSGELLAGDRAAKPTGPIPLWLIHGTNDPVQPIDGRPAHGRLWPALQSEAATAAAFIHANGNRPRPDVVRWDGAPESSGTVSMEVYRGGGAASVSMITIPGGRHAWPVDGPAHVGPGRENAGFSASELVTRLAATAPA